MSRAAIVTGVNGQDGSYLAELLLEKGYSVTGVIRRTSSFRLDKLDAVRRHPRFNIVYGDVSDGSSMFRVVRDFYEKNRDAERHEIYNLAAQSHVQVSFEQPVYTVGVDAVGPLNILEAILALGNPKSFRFYQASTSEMFGKVQEIPQKETTPFYPRSPYGCGKVAAFWLTVNYRESYDMFACNGILFNHESPRRGETFVTRKITLDAAQIAAGKKDVCVLGNLNSLRDWGHARDYVEGMWRMLQADKPEDFVLATGKQITIRAFAESVFLKGFGVKLAWTTDPETGMETGADEKTGRVYVRTDPKFCRPAEVETLLGDPTKAKELLGWVPATTVEQLVDEMVEADFRAFGVTPAH